MVTLSKAKPIFNNSLPKFFENRFNSFKDTEFVNKCFDTFKVRQLEKKFSNIHSNVRAKYSHCTVRYTYIVTSIFMQRL